VLAAVGRVGADGRVGLDHDAVALRGDHADDPFGDEVLPQPPRACADALLAVAQAGLGQSAARARIAVLDAVVAVELGLLGLGERAIGINPRRVLDLILRCRAP
jgi:hypothetical protein